MAEKVKIPPIPTRDVHFEKGILTFKVLEGCAYFPDYHGFTGGDWVNAKIKTKDNDPVLIRLDAGELVIEKLVNYMVDESNGYMVGGEVIELERFKISTQ